MEKEPTGIPSLDARLGGGIPKGGYTLIYGDVGCYKTLHTLFILIEAVKRGEKVVYISTTEDQKKLISRIDSLGIDYPFNAGWITGGIRKHEDYGSFDVVFGDIYSLKKISYLLSRERKDNYYHHPWDLNPIMTVLTLGLEAVGFLPPRSDRVSTKDVYTPLYKRENISENDVKVIIDQIPPTWDRLIENILTIKTIYTHERLTTIHTSLPEVGERIAFLYDTVIRSYRDRDGIKGSIIKNMGETDNSENMIEVKTVRKKTKIEWMR